MGLVAGLAVVLVVGVLHEVGKPIPVGILTYITIIGNGKRLLFLRV